MLGFFSLGVFFFYSLKQKHEFMPSIFIWKFSSLFYTQLHILFSGALLACFTFITITIFIYLSFINMLCYE